MNSRTAPASELAKEEHESWWRGGAHRAVDTVLALLALSASSATALWYHATHGYTLYYGDAEAHLNIARRILDSRSPGYEQLGTVWLPLPHLLMLPFVQVDEWWRSGIGGALPVAVCFVAAGLFLFDAVRNILHSRAAAWTALAAFALNPNLLYLQSAPMTEPVFFACWMGVIAALVRFQRTQSAIWVVAAAVLTLLGTMARYEGWFLVLFVAATVWLTARRRRWVFSIGLGLFSSLAAVWWLGHNWWIYGDVLEFYRGEWSAKGIYERALRAGMSRYPGDGDLGMARLYYLEAAKACVGTYLWWLGIIGAALALAWRRTWMLLLFLVIPLFYNWSIYSSGTPIFVPHLWPFSYYNTRYGLGLLPLLAFGAGVLVALAPRYRAIIAGVLVAGALVSWGLKPAPESWICWKESQVNSEARRAWASQAARLLASEWKHGEGIIAPFGDLTAIFRIAGIPLRNVLHEGDRPHFDASVARPRLFLWERWAVAFSGDAVATAILRVQERSHRYERVAQITTRRAPVVEIYRRTHEHSLYQGTRGQERLSADVEPESEDRASEPDDDESLGDDPGTP